MGRVVRAMVAMWWGCAGVSQPYIPPPVSEAQARAGAEAERAESAAAIRLEDIPAQVRLGVRAEIVRLKIPVRPTLVIVESADAFLDALSGWSIEARYPVLIDDGTDGARENIVRFARAFEPERVELYGGKGEMHAQSIEALQDRVEAVVARAWSAERVEDLAEHWRGLEFAPAGVVAASGADLAWTGAAALAAFRGQPIVWVDAVPDPLGSGMSKERFDALAKEIEAGLEEAGYSWKGVGDEIEAITLCLNGPDKVLIGASTLALTDVLGRADVTETSSSLRWAYASMLPGDAAEAAYRAMSSLFVQPRKAFLFDGYVGFGDGGFETYRPGKAVEILRQAGFEVMVEDSGKDGLGTWRGRAMPPLDAGLVHVNSAGFARMFRLGAAEVMSVEIPALRRPAVVHFIHSFSAQNLGDELSIARRWLDGGAFVYVGAVDEPFLTAFHTPERLAARLASRAPISAAARVETERPWKVNVYGDALFTLGPPANRAAGEVELEGAVDAEARMRSALAEGDYETAIRLLSVLLRDADALRLFRAMTRDDVGAITPGVAQAAFWAAVRARSAEDAVEAAARMTLEQTRAPLTADALWQLGRERLLSGDARAVSVLGRRVREYHVVEDAMLVARGMRSVEGAEAARAYLRSVMEASGDAAVRAQLQDRLRFF